MPLNLRKKIIEGKYVDLKALHPLNQQKKSTKVYQYEDSEDESTRTKRFGKLQDEAESKKDLSELEWLECFLDYSAIYTKEYPSATEGILSYTKFIIDLMKNGKDWKTYDIKFRKARETTSYLWTDILLDSRLAISEKKEERKQGQSPYNKQFFPSKLPDIEVGYCFNYHNKNSKCQRGEFCQYEHTHTLMLSWFEP